MKKYILILFLATSLYSNEDNITEMYDRAKELILESNGVQEKIDAATIIYQKIGKIDKTSNEYKLLKAKLIYKKAYINDSNYKKEYLIIVKKLANQVLQKDPNNIDAYLLQSSAYRNDKTPDSIIRSEQIIKKAYEIDQKNMQVLLSMLDIYKVQKKNDEALKIGLEIIEKSDKVWQKSAALSTLTTIYKRTKNYKEADKAYLKIIELEPDSPWALINYASFLNINSPFKNNIKAIKYAKKSIKMSNTGMGHRVLAKSYYGKGYSMFWGNKGEKKHLDKKGSGKWFEQGIRADKSYHHNYYGLGSYYFYIGMKNKDKKAIQTAEKAFKKCLKIAPSYKLAKNKLKETTSLLRSMKK